MSKQKLLIVITKGNWGGAQRYVYDLATNLPKRQFEITVAVGEGEILSARLAEAEIKTIFLPHLGRDVRAGHDWKSFFSLLKLFRHERPDIIHLNSSKAGILGALAGRIYNLLQATSYKLQATIIFTAHGWAFNENRSWLARAVIAILHWLTILLAHRTIVVADATRRQMHHFPLARRRMMVIRNGLAEINFLDRPNARWKLLGDQAAARGHSWWLGTISELHKNKGLEYLIQAIALWHSRAVLGSSQRPPLVSLTVIIIGEGEERVNLERLIKELKLENTVFLLGRKENASQYLKAFDIFTLTSITEAFPYTILEAGAAGLPIVASGVGGIPEIIKSMESGILVKPHAPSEIVKALEFLLAHPAKTAQFGRTLHDRVTKEFSTVRMVKETIAVYNRANEIVFPKS
ncbi:MAG: glycosyltransferase [Candidatus Vogelbacteria bacterium]